MGWKIAARACPFTLVLAATLAAVSGATAAGSSHLTASFATPQKAAYCRLAVELQSGTVLHLLCWMPRNGLTVALPKTGRTRRLPGSTQATRAYYPRSRRLLPFGRRWWGDATALEGTGGGRTSALFRCVSRRAALTCRNRSGHGFRFLRPTGYRAF